MGSPHLEKQAPAHGLAGEESANMKHSPRLVPSSLHLSCLLSGGATSLLDLPSPILTEFDSYSRLTSGKLQPPKIGWSVSSISFKFTKNKSVMR